MDQKTTSSQVLEDYKRFLYIVSHDLKAPIRHLEFFTNSLFESIEGKVTQDDKEKIDFIKKSMLRLKNMQNALLDLSRIVISQEEPKEIDSQELIENIVADFNHEDNVEIKFSSLPVFLGRYNQMMMVFKAVIGNAIIYNDQNNKIISIFAEIGPNQTKFIIRDNGIGIPQDHHDDVFDMFRRLHAEGEYGGGTGSGLTLTKSIIEFHGGQIWVESNEGGGTDIIFTIPA